MANTNSNGNGRSVSRIRSNCKATARVSSRPMGKTKLRLTPKISCQ